MKELTYQPLWRRTPAFEPRARSEYTYLSYLGLHRYQHRSVGYDNVVRLRLCLYLWWAVLDLNQ